MMEFVLLKRCTVKCMIGRRQKTHLNIKRLQQRLCPLFFHNSGSDHLLEGVVFAFSGWFNVHGGGANLLLLEAGLEQMGHLGFLKIINRDRERRLACGPIRFISRNLDMTAAGNSGELSDVFTCDNSCCIGSISMSKGIQMQISFCYNLVQKLK